MAALSRRVLGAWFLAAAVCTLVATFSAWFFCSYLEHCPSGLGQAAAEFPDNFWVQAWVRWDAGWYEQIARGGYWYTPGQQSPVAYFPTYPLAIALLQALGLNTFVAGILVTTVAGLLAFLVFAQWAKGLVGEHDAWAGTLVLLLYPMSFYLYGVMYSDALFLLVVVGAFYALEKDRVWLATLLGVVATASRPVAPAVVVGLLARRFEKKRLSGKRLAPVDFVPFVAVTGLALYMAFLWQKFDDPLAWIHVHSAPGWSQPPGWRSWLKLEWFRILFPKVAPLVAIRLVGHALATFVALGLVVPIGRRLGWGYAVYVAAVVGIPAISSKDFMSMARYDLAAFPCFLVLALLMKEHPRTRRLWLAISAIGLLLCTAGFGIGGYIA